MDLLKYFCGIDPSSGKLFSNDVTHIGIFDFSWSNSAEKIQKTFLPESGGGISIVDFDEANFSSNIILSKGLICIDQNASEHDIYETLQKDAIDGIGIQSFVRSAVMVPSNNAWAVWMSHFFDIAAIAFLSEEYCFSYLDLHPELPIINADDARHWVNSWKTLAAKRCFLEYIDGNRLVTREPR